MFEDKSKPVVFKSNQTPQRRKSILTISKIPEHIKISVIIVKINVLVKQSGSLSRTLCLFKIGREKKFGVPQHVLGHNQFIYDNSLKLVGNVYNNRYLEAYEHCEINKCDNLMNRDTRPIQFSPLYNLLK